MVDLVPMTEEEFDRFLKVAIEDYTHHVHVYEPDNVEVARHLDFRDYLMAHPRDAERYAELKRALARSYPHDITG